MRNTLGQFVLGHPKIGGFKKGSKHSAQSKVKVSLSLRGRSGPSARRWKGDKAGYVAIHIWLKKALGKAKSCANPRCEYKNPKRFEWASISRTTKRNKDDYVQLCPSCHRRYDINKLTLAQLYESK